MMISEKCKTTYSKLNTFVTNVINRDVTPQITNLNETTTSLQETKLDNKEYITTSFTQSKLKTEDWGATINKNNISLGGYIIFNFECNTNEYYEFDIVVQSTTPIKVSDYEEGYTYAILNTGTHTIKISKSQLIIDSTSITNYDGTDNRLGFVNNSSDTYGNFDFSNKKWYHEATFFDKIYPIGSVHITTNNINPSNYFDGEWERIQDRFLLASGSTYTNGATGGEATHTLTTNEMPSHTHTQNSHTHNPSSIGRNWVPNTQSLSRSKFSTSSSGNKHSVASESIDDWVWGETGSTTATNKNTGGGQAHNNMPPYLVVYMWERVG